MNQSRPVNEMNQSRPVNEMNQSRPVNETVEKLIDKNSPVNSPTVEFLLRLKKMDLAAVTVRDVLILYTIMNKPGLTRLDLCHILNLNAISNVNSNINRLIRWGYIEDRRTDIRKAHPCKLHVLPAGVEFWESIKP